MLDATKNRFNKVLEKYLTRFTFLNSKLINFISGLYK